MATGPKQSKQNSKISVTQKLSISIDITNTIEIDGGGNLSAEQIDAIVNNNLLDIESIISSVLGAFNPANLGNTLIGGSLTVSGDSVVENLESTTVNTGSMIVDNEILIGETNTFSLTNKISMLESNITNINDNIYQLEISYNYLNSTKVNVNKFDELSANFYDLEANFNILDASAVLTNVFNELSGHFYNLATNFNILDASAVLSNIFDDLSKNVYILESSFNILDASVVLSNIFNDLSENFYNLESSFNILDASAILSNVFEDLSGLVRRIEVSFNVLDSSTVKVHIFNDLSINFYSLKEEFDKLDLSAVRIDIFDDLSGEFYLLKSDFTNLDASAVLSDEFEDLSGKFNILNTEFTDLSGKHYDLQDKVNDISFIYTYFELSNNRIIVKLPLDISNLLVLNNDFSYSSIASLDNSNNNILTLEQINQLLATHNFTTTEYVDNIILDIDATLEYVNDVSQTFYEIMTQQPYRFDTSGIANEVNSSSITVAWNFDNILAKIDSSLYRAKLAFMQDDKLSQLPYIDNIQIDISGIADSANTGWIDCNTISIPSDTSYNIYDYKHIIINKFTGTANTDKEKILSSTNAFDLRIYGNNYSNDYPLVDDRSIIFAELSFATAGVPSQPLLQSQSVDYTGGSNRIISTYKVTFTEDGLPTSEAVLIQIETRYSENDTLRSIIYPLDTTESTDNESLSNIVKNVNFNATLTPLTPLLSGTKYDYKARVKNDLNQNDYSIYSAINTSSYTKLPNSNGEVTNITTNITGNTTSITTPNLSNQNNIYINLADNHDIIYSNSSLQNIEITAPYSSTQENTTFGFGKFIDNSNDLVSISVSINNVLKQNISYDGSFSSANVNNVLSNGNTFNFIGSTSIQDMYSNGVNKGFRLKGSFNINNIPKWILP